MPLHGDLGLSGPAVLVLLLLGPAFALVVRRRWRLAAARQAEVRRLVRLAAEETARAEMEAMVAYSAASAAAAAATATATASVATIAKDTSAWPECPVCFSPATARCARCKAVRYWLVDPTALFLAILLISFNYRYSVNNLICGVKLFCRILVSLMILRQCGLDLQILDLKDLYFFSSNFVTSCGLYS